MKKAKKLLSLLLALMLTIGLFPVDISAADMANGYLSISGKKSGNVVISYGDTSKNNIVGKIPPGTLVTIDFSTIIPKEGFVFQQIYVSEDSNGNQPIESANLTKITDTKYQFTVPDMSIYYVKIVFGEPPIPDPEPAITLTSVNGDSVQFESGAVTFRSVVVDMAANNAEMTNGTVQYYLNGNAIGNPVGYDSARVEKGFYIGISTDEIRDSIALKLGENKIYAVYSKDKLSVTSNTVTVTVTKKMISGGNSGFIDVGTTIDAMYDGTNGMSRAQFSVSNEENWKRMGLSYENLTISAIKDGVPYDLQPEDMEIVPSVNGTDTLIMLAAPFPGTYVFTAEIENHTYYTGTYTATVIVGKRPLTIKPDNVEINQGETPTYSFSIGNTTLAGQDTVTNVTYKAVSDSDISTPGTYTLEIDTYDLTNADYYDVTLDTGTLTVYALADYESVKEAISKAEKLDPDDYVDFTGVNDAIEAVDYNKNVNEQEQVDAMARAINEAIAALVYKDADYSKVDEAIAKAEALNKNEYKDFFAVETAIKAVVRGKNITEQEQVDAMARAINEAIAALVYKDADYSKVDEAITKAEALNKDEYKDFSVVDTAIKAVVRGKNITEQEQVDAMARAINEAIAALVYKDADYSKVDEAIAKAEALNKNEYKDFSVVETAIKAVVRGKNITKQEQVDAMARAINEAIAALVYKDADYSKVDEAIAKAEALNKNEYKDFSAVEKAIKAVVRGKNITKQEQVDAMARAIDGAIKALVKKSATNPNSLQTGDNNNIAVWFVLLVVSLAVVGGTVFYGKKKSVK